jgi:hypothetical protein
LMGSIRSLAATINPGGRVVQPGVGGGRDGPPGRPRPRFPGGDSRDVFLTKGDGETSGEVVFREKGRVFTSRGASPASGESSVAPTGYPFFAGEGSVMAGEASPMKSEASPGVSEVSPGARGASPAVGEAPLGKSEAPEGV